MCYIFELQFTTIPGKKMPESVCVFTLCCAGIGVPIMLAYVYGVVPISLCRSGGCGVSAGNGKGVRIEFDDENDNIGSGAAATGKSLWLNGQLTQENDASCISQKNTAKQGRFVPTSHNEYAEYKSGKDPVDLCICLTQNLKRPVNFSFLATILQGLLLSICLNSNDSQLR